jgi:hypothetical protein
MNGVNPNGTLGKYSVTTPDVRYLWASYRRPAPVRTQIIGVVVSDSDNVAVFR